MNKEMLKGQWNQIKGGLKRQWGKLTDDDVTRIEGNYNKFVGVLQERYGYEKERAKKELDAYLDRIETAA